MKRLAPNPALTILLGGALVIGAEGWLLHRARAHATQALARLEQAKQERDSLEIVSPVPTAETEKTIEAGLAEVRGHLAGLQQQLQAGAEASPSDRPPARSRDAFFELADLVEDARAQAAAARVTLRPDERFGFASYATEGPAEQLIPDISRQQRIVRNALGVLFESHPQALLAVRRRTPASEDRSPAVEDGFAPEAGLSLYQPGVVDAEPLRIEFTGPTSALRQLLTQFATLRQPAIVRSVDVESLPVSAGENAAAVSEPVVRRRDSKFTVTVEYLFPAVVGEKPAS